MPLTTRGEAPSNLYRNRFREWYAAIADYMLAYPSATNAEIATALNRAANTISLIRNTDLFRAYFAARRKEWEERHDFGIRKKLHAAADLGLDILLETMTNKRSSIPISQTTTIVTSALDRLGYAPQSGPSTQINVQANDQSRVVVAPVTVDRLEEARSVLRAAQQNRALAPQPFLAPPPLESIPTIENEAEDELSPLTISSE